MGVVVQCKGFHAEPFANDRDDGGNLNSCAYIYHSRAVIESSAVVTLRILDAFAGHPELCQFVFLRVSLLLQLMLIEWILSVRLCCFLPAALRKVLLWSHAACRSPCTCSNHKTNTFYFCKLIVYFIWISSYCLTVFRLVSD